MSNDQEQPYLATYRAWHRGVLAALGVSPGSNAVEAIERLIKERDEAQEVLLRENDNMVSMREKLAAQSRRSERVALTAAAMSGMLNDAGGDMESVTDWALEPIVKRAVEAADTALAALDAETVPLCSTCGLSVPTNAMPEHLEHWCTGVKRSTPSPLTAVERELVEALRDPDANQFFLIWSGEGNDPYHRAGHALRAWYMAAKLRADGGGEHLRDAAEKVEAPHWIHRNLHSNCSECGVLGFSVNMDDHERTCWPAAATKVDLCPRCQLWGFDGSVCRHCGHDQRKRPMDPAPAAAKPDEYGEAPLPNEWVKGYDEGFDCGIDAALGEIRKRSTQQAGCRDARSKDEGPYSPRGLFAQSVCDLDYVAGLIAKKKQGLPGSMGGDYLAACVELAKATCSAYGRPPYTDETGWKFMPEMRRLAAALNRFRAAAAARESANKNTPSDAHSTHCFQGEHMDSCKYGRESECPQRPKPTVDAKEPSTVPICTECGLSVPAYAMPEHLEHWCVGVDRAAHSVAGPTPAAATQVAAAGVAQNEARKREIADLLAPPKSLTLSDAARGGREGLSEAERAWLHFYDTPGEPLNQVYDSGKALAAELRSRRDAHPTFHGIPIIVDPNASSDSLRQPTFIVHKKPWHAEHDEKTWRAAMAVAGLEVERRETKNCPRREHQAVLDRRDEAVAAFRSALAAEKAPAAGEVGNG